MLINYTWSDRRSLCSAAVVLAKRGENTLCGKLENVRLEISGELVFVAARLKRFRDDSSVYRLFTSELSSSEKAKQP